MEEAMDYWDDDMMDEAGISPEDFAEYQRLYGGHQAKTLPGRLPWRKVVADCIKPVLFARDTRQLLTYIVVLCLLQRIIANLMFLPAKVRSLSTGILGVCAVYLTMGGKTLMPMVGVFGVVLLVVFWMIIRKRNCGVLVMLLCAAFMLLFQFAYPSKQFTKMRGVLMILIMKLVSVGVDVDSGVNGDMDAIALFGYCFDVSSVLFGPWRRIGDHLTALDRPGSIVEQLKSCFYACLKLALCVFFLIYSSCLVEWLIPDNAANISPWFVAFRDAQSYRTSHYFVSMLAEMSVLLAGLDHGNAVVTKPLYIELPRSLVETVVHWNVPMHRWLRHYVFENARNYGNAFAVLCTYVASAFLHGLNFQLSAVLLSLGVYTYAEHVLREKLARTYDACIRARKCASTCNHQYKKTHAVVMLVNFGFFCLALFHLTYLGMPFVSVGDGDEHGYSWRHTLTVWRQFHFLSHWIAALTLYLAWSI